jgi:hypothetical protein
LRFDVQRHFGGLRACSLQFGGGVKMHLRGMSEKARTGLSAIEGNSNEFDSEIHANFSCFFADPA